MIVKRRPMPSAAITSHLFRRACGKFTTGVAVATVLGPDGTPHGLTVNSFTSVSCTPPLVLICIDHRSTVLPYLRRSRFYGINVLREEQVDISQRFAFRSEDRFDGLEWAGGETGVPLLEHAMASLECRLHQTHEAGDHAVLIGEVVSARVNEGKPLLYFGGAYHYVR